MPVLLTVDLESPNTSCLGFDILSITTLLGNHWPRLMMHLGALLAAVGDPGSTTYLSPPVSTLFFSLPSEVDQWTRCQNLLPDISVCR